MSTDINFCPACGRNLPAEAPYCPMCGMRLNDPTAEMRERSREVRNRDRTNIAVALLLIYSVPAVLFGALVYLNAYELSELIFDSMSDMYGSLLAGYTVESMASELEFQMMLTVIGGLIGAVSAVFAIMRKYWIVTVILCIASAALGFSMILGLIIGIIAFWLLYQSRPAFEN